MEEIKFEAIYKVAKHVLKAPEKNMGYNHGNSQEYTKANCEKWDVPFIEGFVDCDTYSTKTRFRVQGYYPFKTPDDLLNLPEEQLLFMVDALPDEPCSFGNHIAHDEEGYYICLFSA